VGCSPLIVLFLLFIAVNIRYGLDVSERDGTAPAPLPRIDPTTPVAKLLPAAPEVSKAPVYLGEDLTSVPELALENVSRATAEEWRDRKARAVVAALELNSKEEDGFLKALLGARPDLAGVSFTMGSACRTRGERAKAFKLAADAVQSQKGAALLAESAAPDEKGEKQPHFYEAHQAVVSQVIFAEDAPKQVALVRALASIPRPEATRTLARVAVFSTHEAVRTAAVAALAVRREADTAEVFAAGLRYPWPAIAANSASTIAKLKRKDLIPQLRAMLDAPDPRGPRVEVVAGRNETVAHELVRVNHHRNCLLCHAPVERGRSPAETLVAEIPVPAQSLPSASAGYGNSDSNLLVRIDVTYLRQDFSAMLAVTDWTVETWPALQRFDFLVRKRVLTPAEAAGLRTRLAGESPYRRAAERALRELAGVTVSTPFAFGLSPRMSLHP
jgi:hypothetical protein